MLHKKITRRRGTEAGGNQGRGDRPLPEVPEGEGEVRVPLVVRLERLAAGYESEWKAADAEVTRERAAEEELTTRLAVVSEGRDFIQEAARAVQEAAHKRITHLVTRCLKSVFGEEGYEFRIVTEKKRGKAEARCVFVRGGNEYDWQQVGGGVVDVASFALRLAVLTVRRPKVRRLLVLDEPARHLSEEYTEAFGQLLLQLAEEMDYQIILVTHKEGLKVGKVIQLPVSPSRDAPPRRTTRGRGRGG